MNVETDVRPRLARVRELVKVLAVRAELGVVEDLGPSRVLARGALLGARVQELGRLRGETEASTHLGRRDAKELGRVGEIADKVERVDVSPLEVAGLGAARERERADGGGGGSMTMVATRPKPRAPCAPRMGPHDTGPVKDSQLDDDPVSLARPEPPATPLGLPPIPHVLAPPRQDQVGPAAKVLVALARDGPAVEHVSEVDGLARGACRRGGRHDAAVGAETAEAAVGVHGELEVRDGGGGRGEEEEVALRWAEGSDWEEGGPLRGTSSR